MDLGGVPTVGEDELAPHSEEQREGRDAGRKREPTTDLTELWERQRDLRGRGTRARLERQRGGRSEGDPGPKGDPGPAGDPTTVVPPGAVADRRVSPGRLAELTHNKLVLRKAKVGPSLDSSKGATVACPDSHPFVFEGGAEATAHIGFVAFGPVVIDANYPVVWLSNHSLAPGQA